MTTIRWIALLLTLSVILTGCGCGMLEGFLLAQPVAEPTPAPPTMGNEPPALYLLQGDIAFPMNRGSFCWGTAENSLCADVFIFPPVYPTDEYMLVIGNTLELRFDAPFPDTLTAEFYSANSANIPTAAVMDANGRILVTIPDAILGDYTLTVFATWTGKPKGDASYAAPVRFKP